MLSEKIQDALNDQLNYEFYSAFIYLSMAAYFESIDLDGFANWMKVQFEEEQAHAMMFFNYINERGGRVQLKEIACPDLEWKNPLGAFEDALGHEQKVTRRINNLMSMAQEEKDYASVNFLLWFVNEQVEEEASVNEIVQHLKLIKGEGHGLFMINRELAARTFTPPTPLGA
jgi:ferritin